MKYSNQATLRGRGGKPVGLILYPDAGIVGRITVLFFGFVFWLKDLLLSVFRDDSFD